MNSTVHRREKYRAAKNDRTIFSRLHGNQRVIDLPRHSQTPQMLLDQFEIPVYAPVLTLSFFARDRIFYLAPVHKFISHTHKLARIHT